MPVCGSKGKKRDINSGVTSQKVVIPKGVVNPDETTIIEIPARLQKQPIVVAKRRTEPLGSCLDDHTTSNTSSAPLKTQTPRSASPLTLHTSHIQPVVATASNFTTKFCPTNPEGVRRVMPASPLTNLVKLEDVGADVNFDLNQTEEQERLQLQFDLEAFQKARRRLIEHASRFAAQPSGVTKYVPATSPRCKKRPNILYICNSVSDSHKKTSSAASIQANSGALSNCNSFEYLSRRDYDKDTQQGNVLEQISPSIVDKIQFILSWNNVKESQVMYLRQCTFKLELTSTDVWAPQYYNHHSTSTTSSKNESSLSSAKAPSSIMNQMFPTEKLENHSFVNEIHPESGGVFPPSVTQTTFMRVLRLATNNTNKSNTYNKRSAQTRLQRNQFTIVDDQNSIKRNDYKYNHGDSNDLCGTVFSENATSSSVNSLHSNYTSPRYFLACLEYETRSKQLLEEKLSMANKNHLVDFAREGLKQQFYGVNNVSFVGMSPLNKPKNLLEHDQIPKPIDNSNYQLQIQHFIGLCNLLQKPHVEDMKGLKKCTTLYIVTSSSPGTSTKKSGCCIKNCKNPCCKGYISHYRRKSAHLETNEVSKSKCTCNDQEVSDSKVQSSSSIPCAAWSTIDDAIFDLQNARLVSGQQFITSGCDKKSRTSIRRYTFEISLETSELQPSHTCGQLSPSSQTPGGSYSHPPSFDDSYSNDFSSGPVTSGQAPITSYYLPSSDQVSNQAARSLVTFSDQTSSGRGSFSIPTSGQFSYYPPPSSDPVLSDSIFSSSQAHAPSSGKNLYYPTPVPGQVSSERAPSSEHVPNDRVPTFDQAPYYPVTASGQSPSCATAAFGATAVVLDASSDQDVSCPTLSSSPPPSSSSAPSSDQNPDNAVISSDQAVGCSTLSSSPPPSSSSASSSDQNPDDAAISSDQAVGCPTLSSSPHPSSSSAPSSDQNPGDAAISSDQAVGYRASSSDEACQAAVYQTACDPACEAVSCQTFHFNCTTCNKEIQTQKRSKSGSSDHALSYGQDPGNPTLFPDRTACGYIISSDQALYDSTFKAAVCQTGCKAVACQTSLLNCTTCNTATQTQKQAKLVSSDPTLFFGQDPGDSAFSLDRTACSVILSPPQVPYDSTSESAVCQTGCNPACEPVSCQTALLNCTTCNKVNQTQKRSKPAICSPILSKSSSSSDSSTSSESDSTPEHLSSRLCSCCKINNDSNYGQTNIKYILCHPCHYYNQQNNNFLHSVHICTYYNNSRKQETIEQIRKTIQELESIEREADCCESKTSHSSSGSCSNCECKMNDSLTKKKGGIAYDVILESDDNVKKKKHEKINQPELDQLNIKVVSPSSSTINEFECEQSGKENDSSKNHANSKYKQKPAPQDYVVYSDKHTSIASVEQRRQCLLDLAYMREKRCQKYKQLLALTNGVPFKKCNNKSKKL